MVLWHGHGSPVQETPDEKEFGIYYIRQAIHNNFVEDPHFCLVAESTFYKIATLQN